MSIDWITVVAQLANFIVLVGLLRRFLYRPILDGIDAREQEISERMSAAIHIGEAAEQVKAEHEAAVERLRGGRDRLLADARTLAEADRDALLADTRSELQREREEQEKRNAAEAIRYAAEFHREGAEALLALTRKALADLADESLEQRIVEHALTHVDELSAPLEAALADAREVVITTRDPLSADARENVGATLSVAMPGVEPRFKSDPAQAPGLTLRIGSAQLGWTTESYLDGLEKLLRRSFGARARGSTRAA